MHIRAVPDGGAAGSFVPTPLPYTFYDLYTAGAFPRTLDRRQPLPSAFLPRAIQNGSSFDTKLQIWREAFVTPTACPLAYGGNSAARIADAVRFDEHENSSMYGCFLIGCIEPPALAVTGSYSTASERFPFVPQTSGDVGGWLFLNLNNGGSAGYTAARGNYRFGTTTNGARQSQAWVVTSMFAEGRYAVEMDAAAVGNGCSPAPELATKVPIGPAPNPNP